MSKGYKNVFGTNYRTEYFKHNKGFMGMYMCAYCGKILPRSAVTVDHVIPKSKFLANKLWNANKKGNLVAACRNCNSSKGAKTDIRILQGQLARIFGVPGIWIGMLISVVYKAISFVTRRGVLALLGFGLSKVLKVLLQIPLKVKFVALGAGLLYVNYTSGSILGQWVGDLILELKDVIINI